MYTKGLGVAQDEAQAIAWYRKAAAQGNVSAQNNLAKLGIDWQAA
jgi:TPR repeat protein